MMRQSWRGGRVDVEGILVETDVFNNTTPFGHLDDVREDGVDNMRGKL